MFVPISPNKIPQHFHIGRTYLPTVPHKAIHLSIPNFDYEQNTQLRRTAVHCNRERRPISRPQGKIHFPVASGNKETDIILGDAPADNITTSSRQVPRAKMGIHRILYLCELGFYACVVFGESRQILRFLGPAGCGAVRGGRMP